MNWTLHFFPLKFSLWMWHGPKVHAFWHKKQLQIIYDIWCIHCIIVTIWNFDHLITLKRLQIELVINHFMYLDCLFTFWPFDQDGNLKMFPWNYILPKNYNNYKYFKHYNDFCLKWVHSNVFLPVMWHFDLCKITRFNYMCDYINFINDIFI
jgi:hypothetical protein